MSAKNEENLTTDAFPSPSRDNVDDELNSSSQNERNDSNRRHSGSSSKSTQRNRGSSESDDSDPSNPRKCCNSSRRMYSSKSQEGYHGPNGNKFHHLSSKFDIETFFSAYASVINISNATGIHIGSNYTYYINSNKDLKQNPLNKNKDIPKSDKINFLLDSKDRVTEKDIQYLAAHIDSTWMETARKLDYSEGQISQFHTDFITNGLKEVRVTSIL